MTGDYSIISNTERRMDTQARLQGYHYHLEMMGKEVYLIKHVDGV
jgi:hypothetical protein